jgi:hypothetical protein
MKPNPIGEETGKNPLAAQAIDRVLDAEREARATVAVCEKAGSTAVEAARQIARGIVERAEARTVALHGRAAKNLDRCATALMELRMKKAAEVVRQLSDPGRLGVALERVAAQLTTEAVVADVA